MTPTSADYYANAAWTDRAPLMIQTLLVESLENSRRIVGVGRDPLSVRPTYVLQSELREFQAEYFVNLFAFSGQHYNRDVISVCPKQFTYF